MKKGHLIFSICILFGCFGKDPVFNSGHEGEPLPPFDVLLLDSATYINTENLVQDKPIALFYFSPHCTYCRALTREIIEHHKIFNEIQLVMISNSPLKEIRDYSNQYKLKEHSNIIIGQDLKSFFSNYFKIPGVPSIAVYGKKRILKRVILGTVSPNEIKKTALD